MQTEPIGGMAAALTKKWWVFLVQGIIMILLAFLAFSQPTTLIQFIGIYALFEGALKLFAGFGPRPGDQSRWPALIIGAISVTVGAIILANPTGAAGVMTYLIAAWAVVVGLLLILWGIRLRQEIHDEWLLIISGGLSILFGVVAFANVGAGYLTLQFFFGTFMMVGGILAVLLALRIRSAGVYIGAIGRSR